MGKKILAAFDGTKYGKFLCLDLLCGNQDRRITLNLVAPTRYAHNAPVLVTAIPKGIRWATALYAKAWSLQNGLAAVSIPGSDGKAVTTEEAIEEAMKLAAIAVAPYCRIY